MKWKKCILPATEDCQKALVKMKKEKVLVVPSGSLEGKRQQVEEDEDLLVKKKWKPEVVIQIVL